MTIPSVKQCFAAAFLAALSFFRVEAAPADTRPARLVLYVNEKDARVSQAIKQLETALEKAGVTSRHNVRFHHVVVDLWRPASIREKLLQALELHPAVIIATNSDIATIAKSLTLEVPIIFASHQDPIRLGLIDSLARPGGNVTGFTFFVPVDDKRLELLRQLAPRARKLGILIDRWWEEEGGGRDVAIRARTALGFEPHLFEVETLDDLRTALSSPEAREMQAWYVPTGALAFYEPAAMVQMLDRMGKPVVFNATQFVEKGGLISYQQLLTLQDSANLWATMIGLILDGLPPSEIPIERPKSFELAVNVGAARRLGLEIPASLIKRADRVFAGRVAPAGGEKR